MHGVKVGKEEEKDGKMKISHAERKIWDQLTDLPVTVRWVPPPNTHHSDTQLYINLLSLDALEQVVVSLTWPFQVF